MKFLKNIFKVVLGNGAAIISGIFVGFVLPKIISLYDYGFYKVFTLYFNYIGVLSFGIIDGIVLKYGKYDYQELERKRFRSFFAWYLIVNTFFTVALLIVSLFVANLDYSFVLLLLCANILPVNCTGYFQQISQITQRFKEFSVRKIVHSVLNIAFILVLYLFYKFEFSNITYKIYLIGVLVINVLLNLWYIVTYRDIIFGEKESLGSSIKEVLSLMKIGFPLLLSNLCTTFLLSLDRQFVSILFSIEEYAVYGFAYSMLSLLTVATSSIATVIYPLFKRMDKEVLISNYSNINACVMVFSFVIVLVFYPLCYFINWYLPLYFNSLEIFRIILPGIAISTVVTVVLHNYYKVFDITSIFLRKSIIILFVSLVLNFVAYFCFHTREAISVASVISLLIWYVMTEFSLRKKCVIKVKNLIYMIVMCACFYLCTILTLYWLGFIINVVLLAVVTLLLYRKDAKNIIKLIKNN